MTAATPDLPDHMTAAVFRELAQQSRERRSTLVPDTPMNRYGIACSEVFEEIMLRHAAGEGLHKELMDEMFARQKALTAVHGVEP